VFNTHSPTGRKRLRKICNEFILHFGPRSAFAGLPPFTLEEVMRNAVVCVVLLFLCAGAAVAQSTVHVAAGELSVPFGAVSGRLITVGDYLVFVDDDRPELSFALSRADVQELTVNNRVAAIQAVRPIRDRSGERTQLNIRLEGDNEARALTSWFGSANRRVAESSSSSNSPDTVSNSTSTARNSNMIYEARHDHRLVRSCRGRLIITEKSLSYESIDNLSDSRQWQYTDIKELTLSNPYEIHIVPFDGGEYKLGLQGTGMDKAAFKALVDRVTAARVTRDGAGQRN
jgi:hypothetical protein